jgi:hypothetical protein
MHLAFSGLVYQRFGPHSMKRKTIQKCLFNNQSCHLPGSCGRISGWNQSSPCGTHAPGVCHCRAHACLLPRLSCFPAPSSTFERPRCIWAWGMLVPAACMPGYVCRVHFPAILRIISADPAWSIPSIRRQQLDQENEVLDSTSPARPWAPVATCQQMWVDHPSTETLR